MGQELDSSSESNWPNFFSAPTHRMDESNTANISLEEKNKVKSEENFQQWIRLLNKMTSFF